LEPAFQQLIERLKASAIVAKLTECNVLTRELFLLQADTFLADDEWKSLKSFVTLLKKNLETFADLQAAGVTFPDPAADALCESWPTKAAFQSSEWADVKALLDKKKASAKLIKNVAGLHGGHKGQEEEVKRPKFEAAFEDLLSSCNASVLQGPLAQRHVSTRVDFLKDLASLRDDDLFASHKNLLDRLAEQLQVFQLLQDAPVSISQDVVDAVCSKYPTKQLFTRASEQEIKSSLSASADPKDVNKVLKLHKKEQAAQKKEENKKSLEEQGTELKKRREEAKELMEQRKQQIKEMKEALKNMAGTDAKAKLEQLTKSFPDVMNALKARGALGDGKNLDLVIENEMRGLDKMITSCTAITDSLDNLPSKLDGGSLRFGVRISKDGDIRRGQELLLAEDDAAFTIHNPRSPAETKVEHFTSKQQYEEFASKAEATGWSVAVAVSGRYKMVSGGAAADYEEEKQSQKVDVKQTRTNEVVVSRNIFLPTKVLNITGDALRLNVPALKKLEKVTNPAAARAFLDELGSHVLIGEVTVGGRMEFAFKANSKETATVHEFLAMESSKFAAQVKADVSGIIASVSAEASYGTSESKQDAERTAKLDSESTTTTTIKAWGPLVSDLGLFVNTLNASTSFWYVLDRASPQFRLGVWDIARQHDKLQDNDQFQRSVDLLEDVWRSDVAADGNPLLWSPRSSNPKLQADELVQCLFYVCHVNEWLHPLGKRIAAFCANVRKGIEFFRDAKFLVDAMTSTPGSDNAVAALFDLILSSSDDTSKSALKELLFGQTDSTRAIHQSFEGRDDLKVWKRRFQEALPEPAEVPCTLDALKEAISDKQRDRFSAILLAAYSNSGVEFHPLAVKIVELLQGMWSPVSHFIDAVVRWDLVDRIVDSAVNPSDSPDPSESEEVSLPLPPPFMPPASTDEKKGKKSMSSLLVDRVMPPSSEPDSHTLCLLDALRHRMDFPKLTKVPDPSSEPGSAVDQGQAGDDGWGDLFQPETKDGKTPTSLQIVSLQSTLLKLLDEHDIPAQREINRLLLSRRMAVPFVAPLTSAIDVYACRTEQLRLVPVEGVRGAVHDLATDRDLPRVLVCSTRGKEASKTHSIIKSVFGVNSLHCEDRAEGVVFDEDFVVEVGLGFLPASDTSDAKEALPRACIVLHAMFSSAGAASVANGPVEQLYPLVDWAVIETLPEEPQQLVKVHKIQDKVKHLLIFSEGQVGTRVHGNITLLCCQTEQLETKAPALAPPQFFQPHAPQLLQPGAPQRASLYEAVKSALCLQTQQPKDKTFSDLLARVNGLTIDAPLLRRDVYTCQSLFAKEAKLKQQLQKAKAKGVRGEIVVLEQELQLVRQQKMTAVNKAAHDPLLRLFQDIFSIGSTEQRVLLMMDLEQKLNEANLKVKQDLFRDRRTMSAEQQLALQAKLTDQSVYFEHLWRELSHLCILNPKSHSSLAQAAAQHLLDGFTVELIDGQSDVVHQPWMMSVIQRLNAMLPKSRSSPGGHNRFCVHSTCGVQSSGKSTMLNITYGARLRSSVGRCTIGVNMMLIRAENRQGYDYVLLLDTEGVRSPEFKGKPESFVRDNKMVALATLPAHMTTTMFPGEDDRMICEVLPIVMLASRASQLSDTVNNGFGTQMFFLYRGIDVNNKDKLIDIMSSLKLELEKAQRIVLTGEMKLEDSTGDQSTDHKSPPMELIFDIQMHPNDPDNSDVRVMGINKISEMPPADLLVTSYGADLMKMREYMHNRIVARADGNFAGLTGEQLVSKLDLVFRSIADSDWFLNFQTIRDRFTYEALSTKMQGYKRDFGLVCMQAVQKLKQDYVKNPANKDTLTADAKKTINTKEAETKARIDKLFENPLYTQWKPTMLDGWKAFVQSQLNLFSQEVALYFEVQVSFPKMVADELECMRETVRKHKDELKNEAKFGSMFKDLWEASQNRLVQKRPSRVVEVPGLIRAALTDVQQQHANADIDAYRDVFKRQWKDDMKANQAMVSQLVTPIMSQSKGFWDKLKRMFTSSNKDSQSQLVAQFINLFFDKLKDACPRAELVRSGYQDHIVITIEQQLHLLLGPSAYPAKVRTILYLAAEHFLIQIMTEAQHQYESENYPAAMFARRKQEMHEFCKSVQQGMTNADEFKKVFQGWISNAIKPCVLESLTGRLLALFVDKEVVANILNTERFLSILDADLLRLSDAGSLHDLFSFLREPTSHVDDILQRAARHFLAHEARGKFTLVKQSLIDSITKAEKTAVYIREDGGIEEHKQSGSEMFMEELTAYLKGSDDLSQLINDVPNDLRSRNVPKSEFKGIAADLRKFVDQLPEWRFPSAYDIVRTLLQKLGKLSNRPKVCAEPCPRCKAPCMYSQGHQGDHRAVHQPAGLSGGQWKGSGILCKESCTRSLERRDLMVFGERSVSYCDFSKEYPAWTLNAPSSSQSPEHSLRIREYLFAQHQEWLVMNRHTSSKVNTDGDVASWRNIGDARAFRQHYLTLLTDLSKDAQVSLF